MSACGLEALRCGLQWRRQWRCWREALEGAIGGQEEEEVDKEDGKDEKEVLRSQLHGLLLASLSAEEENPSRAGSALVAALLAVSGVLKLGRGQVPEKQIGRSRPAETFGIIQGKRLAMFQSDIVDVFLQLVPRLAEFTLDNRCSLNTQAFFLKTFKDVIRHLSLSHKMINQLPSGNQLLRTAMLRLEEVLRLADPGQVDWDASSAGYFILRLLKLVKEGHELLELVSTSTWDQETKFSTTLVDALLHSLNNMLHRYVANSFAACMKTDRELRDFVFVGRESVFACDKRLIFVNMAYIGLLCAKFSNFCEKNRLENANVISLTFHRLINLCAELSGSEEGEERMERHFDNGLIFLLDCCFQLDDGLLVHFLCALAEAESLMNSRNVNQMSKRARVEIDGDKNSKRLNSEIGLPPFLPLFCYFLLNTEYPIGLTENDSGGPSFIFTTLAASSDDSLLLLMSKFLKSMSTEHSTTTLIYQFEILEKFLNCHYRQKQQQQRSTKNREKRNITKPAGVLTFVASEDHKLFETSCGIMENCLDSGSSQIYAVVSELISSVEAENEQIERYISLQSDQHSLIQFLVSMLEKFQGDLRKAETSQGRELFFNPKLLLRHMQPVIKILKSLI